MNTYIILGGGPVGCYLAHKLLAQENTRVLMFEGGTFVRPQVIRIPFSIANQLPEAVKNNMFADEATRARLFSPCDANDINSWPTPGYSYWPWISIGAFQESMLDFLNSYPDYHNRFSFIAAHGNVSDLQFQSQIQHLENITAIFCTCGTYAAALREKMNLLDGKPAEFKGHGIYLIYQNEYVENYQRENIPLAYHALGENGLSYAASNNSRYDVQLYTYPAGRLAAVLQDIPASFIERAKYRTTQAPLNLGGAGLPDDARLWFEQYRDHVQAETAKARISLPTDLTKIKIYYAPRTEYYWQTAATTFVLGNQSIPLFFLGDSAGSTDYKFGLSVGRGFLAVEEVTASMIYHKNDFAHIALHLQNYWHTVISREFNKGPLLSQEPWIQYQYLIKGRDVKFSDTNIIQYNRDEQYENYLDEYQHLTANFSKTSEAGALVFVNTKALQENITHIMSFAKQCAESKIIGVVKSNGYGLGANLVSALAIQSGIDFLAVAKLQEAVMLRQSAIPNSHSVRLMTFEAPMPYDLSTYAANNIEVILPAGKSIAMLSEWLLHKQRRLPHALKVHIMVDTGMRRDGGSHANSPESVLNTIKALQALDQTQIEFAGLATHLACYRCTDYNGAEVVNFRSLQFQRLLQVINFLLSEGITLPSLHIGGGLALLAERWPLQFSHLAQQHAIQLYTRVGHGLYGMEFEQDLHADSPALRSVVKLDLQVRHVFYVEEGEPVSYGGYWRAPKNGAWIATLAGGWADGIPRTAQTLGEWENGMHVSINKELYPVVGKINMNAMMVNLGTDTSVKPGDRAIIFGWESHEPKLNDLALLSGQISPSVMVNVPTILPRIIISE